MVYTCACIALRLTVSGVAGIVIALFPRNLFLRAFGSYALSLGSFELMFIRIRGIFLYSVNFEKARDWAIIQVYE